MAEDGYEANEAPAAPPGGQGCDLLVGDDQVASAVAAAARPETEAVADADEFHLGNVFYDAYRMYHSLLQASDGSSPTQADLDKLLTQLKAIAWRVDQLRIFSPNEELDDINTADLKFLLVPFMLGETSAATQDMSTRLAVLRGALVYWRTFIQLGERFKLFHSEDLKALGRATGDSLNANAKRDEKIARYKRTKELDQKAAWLFKKKRIAAGDEFCWGHSAFDEDLERDLILALIAKAASETADHVASAEAELPLLEMMKARGGPGAAPSAKSDEPPPEKPWCVRIQDKSELQKLFLQQVFQPDIPMPTMSLAEYADNEMAQAREKKEQTANQQFMQRAAEISSYGGDRWFDGDRYGSKEDDEEYGDAKTYKDRNWDDWKDEHPFGSGNKKGNIG